MTVAEALRAAADRLTAVADEPRREARLLLAHALGVARTELIREPGRPVDAALLAPLLERRLSREPMALILGRQEFWSMEFLVSAATLIPRPDSESVVEAAMAARAGRAPERILDLGTGTGCLLLALLREYPGAFGIGVDLGAEAAALAHCNARRLGLIDRCAFVCGDWANALNGRFDLVVSNPPYIAAPDLPGLMPEVSRYEPARALDGGADGYAAYRAILPRLPAILTRHGSAVLEVGAGQAGEVFALAHGLGFRAHARRDLSGIERAVVLSRAIE